MNSPLLETKHLRSGMPTTRWSIVEAVNGDPAQRLRALEVFAQDYWPAVYAFARVKGLAPMDAEDLTQEFLASLMSDDTSFQDLSAAKGRFRSWLLASLTNFLRKYWRNRSRIKRGGRMTHLSIDRDLGEAWLEASATDRDSPDVVFERRWVAGILERSWKALATSYEKEGRLALAQALAPTIAGAGERKGYADAAEKLGMSESNLRVAAFRMRKKLRALIREEVAATVDSPEAVDAEIDYLFTIFNPR